MATTTNGSSSTATDGMSAAERLMQAHKVTVEDAADEDLPSAPADATATTAGAGPESESNDNGGSGSKAAGKKPVRDAPAPAAKVNRPALDTQSEELFPSLGAPKAPNAGSSMWSKKPAAVGNANGTANIRPVNAAAGAGKPSSGMVSSAGIQRGPAQVNLPGRNSEQVVIPASFMTPRAQLKRPVADILRDINKRSKANVEMKSGPGGSYIIEGTGPTDAVRIALKEVASQLCSKQTARVPVPMSLRGRIVGKQGATIQAISKKTGARINISKQEAAEILEDDDMDATIDVTIEGDPFAVQMARGDIERIVNEHTATGTSRLKNIPAEYYPFLAAPHNQRLHGLQQGRDLKINIPQYHTWNLQSPPAVPAARQPAAFKPQAALPIQLAGDRQAVAEARAEIERQVQELQQLLTLEQVSVEKGRHQFIVGEKGKALHDFLQETGCSVILPPDGDESEMLAVVGPADKIEEATNKVMELASSMAMASADIARAHASAPNGAQVHARDITRYLKQRSAFQDLERTHDARIVPDSAGAWQIYARDGKNAIKARADIMSLIAGHPPSRFQSVQVDPFYHQHLRENAAPQIREKHGVRVILPDEFSNEPVLLVFEDRAPSPEYSLPRGAPQAQQVQTFEQALQQAQQEIGALLSGRPEIVSKQVDAPPKFHDKIRRHVDKHHSRLEEGQLPVQVSYGGPRQAAPRRVPAPSLDLRGPQNSVDELFASLISFIEQEHRDELERDFKLSFEFPQRHANHLIGRKGEHINSLREQFDVDIQLNEGQCEIKGPEAKANLCKQHILQLVKKLEDEKVHHLNIPAEFHKDLIGAQGSQVNRLQDRYGVRVQFPRNRQGVEDDSATNEAGPRRDAQKPHEVIVKGPSKGADGCREELLSLLEYVKDNSHSATVSVAQSQLPSLIGAGGKEMDALRLESGAQIDVPSSREAAGPEGRVEIKIRGSKKAVDEAKKLVQEKAKVFDNTVTRTLDVERRHHRHIIGPGGSNLRGIILQAGGPEDTRLHNRMIRFPKTDAEGNDIRIEGQKAIVDKICAAIQAVVAEHESQVTEILEVKPDKHRLLIGRGGETRRQLEQQFSVSINVPRQSETGPQRSQVRITGQPAEVEKAKAHVLELTKDQEGETVAVPRKFHHIIADNGQFFRRLRNDHKVTVDHDGQRPPPKSAAPVPSRANGGGAMPLITDEPSADSHSWEMHDLHGSTEDGEIPWVLSGPSVEAVQAARAKLNSAIADAGKLDTIGFLILPDPRTYRHVIGPGGSEINRIRKASGTKIQVPRDQNRGEAIEIQGSKQGVQQAKDSILEVVQNNSQRE